MGDAHDDVIGAEYAVTRREDPRIAVLIHAALGEARTIVNVGAGAGSYEPRDRPVLAAAETVARWRASGSTSGKCPFAATRPTGREVLGPRRRQQNGVVLRLRLARHEARHAPAGERLQPVAGADPERCLAAVDDETGARRDRLAVLRQVQVVDPALGQVLHAADLDDHRPVAVLVRPSDTERGKRARRELRAVHLGDETRLEARAALDEVAAGERRARERRGEQKLEHSPAGQAGPTRRSAAR